MSDYLIRVRRTPDGYRATLRAIAPSTRMSTSEGLAEQLRTAVEALERIAAISVDDRRLNIPYRPRLQNAVAIATAALAVIRGTV